MKNASTAVKRYAFFSLALLMTLIAAVLLTTVTATAAKVHSEPALPPRPSAPTPAPKKAPVSVDHPRTARIELTVTEAQAGAWSVVQWRDGDGNWQDVDSWRAPVSDKPTVWWVTEKHFGHGPFRWVIYLPNEKSTLLTSEMFYLPSAAGEAVAIRL